MKTVQKTIFRLLILVAVLSCYGLDTYANSTLSPICVEFSDSANKGTNTISDTDPLNDDQIPQLNFYHKYSVLKCQEPISKDSFLFTDINFSIWQPPQL